jgi:hypothetical protein
VNAVNNFCDLFSAAGGLTLALSLEGWILKNLFLRGIVMNKVGPAMNLTGTTMNYVASRPSASCF